MEEERNKATSVPSLSLSDSLEALHSKVIVGESELSRGPGVDRAVLPVATLVHGQEEVVHSCSEVSHPAMQGSSTEAATPSEFIHVHSKHA